MTKSSNSKDQLASWELMKATKVAIWTAAEWRLATEYRDTIDDEHALEALDEMIATYDSKRGMPTGAPVRKPLSVGKEGSSASTEEIASADLLKRTATACLEYVYRHGLDRVRGNASILDQATSWRGLTVTTKRQLKEIERAFRVVVSDVRTSYLSAEEFGRLEAVLRENGLIDIGKRRRQ